MKTLLTLALLAVPVVGTPLAAQEADSPPNPDAQAVRAVIESVAARIESGDLAAVDTLFAEGRGVHIIEGAGVSHGWADYRDNHLKPELDTFESLEYRFFRIEPEVRGDVAWAGFSYELAADMESGRVEMAGRGTAVLEKTDGRWQVVHLHTSGRRRS